MKLIVVLPVLPTYARTFSSEETVIATMKLNTIINVVRMAKRRSLISSFVKLDPGLTGLRSALRDGEVSLF
jgi:hypothetical protein